MNEQKNETNRYRVPEPIGQLMAFLPSWPGSLLFVSALNAILTPRLPEDVMEAITGKQLRLTVMDAQLDFNFVWTKGGFVAGWSDVEPDLTISASVYDFYLLSKREEDPDTLFFSRRLIMEGDTELGLLLKNTLDAMDLNVFELVKTLPLKKILSWIPGYKKDEI